MKRSLLTLAILMTVSTLAQAQKYWGYDRESDQIYPSNVYVDSCPRDKYAECPRKSDDYYSEFIDLITNNRVESSLDATATIRVNSYGDGHDRLLVTAARDVIVNMNNQAKVKKQSLTKSHLLALILKDDRINNSVTFNSIVRLIESIDKLKK